MQHFIGREKELKRLEETKTSKALHLTMITTKGLVRNNWSDTLVRNDLKMDVLFSS